ncbi:MAG: hypothetical protein HY275_11190 [Gemmatimonadetes bacterium]|nr:hypothetical protein [Gemmatimonadota bacterium]
MLRRCRRFAVLALLAQASAVGARAMGGGCERPCAAAATAERPAGDAPSAAARMAGKPMSGMRMTDHDDEARPEASAAAQASSAATPSDAAPHSSHEGAAPDACPLGAACAAPAVPVVGTVAPIANGAPSAAPLARNLRVPASDTRSPDAPPPRA